MAEKITAWKSDDGKLHYTEDEARENELFLLMSKGLYRAAQETRGVPESSTRIDPIDSMKSNDAAPRVVFDILSRHFGSQ